MGTLEVFEAATNLFTRCFKVKDDKEWINVVVGSSDAGPTNCIGTLSFTICELQSAIGAYDVEIKDNEIQMRTLRPPRLVALSNNTEVSPTDEKNHDGYFPSTLVRN